VARDVIEKRDILQTIVAGLQISKLSDFAELAMFAMSHLKRRDVRAAS
jgi:hypothetical protein